MVQIYEAANSREAKAGAAETRTLKFWITGTDDESTALAVLRARTPLSYCGLWLQDWSVRPFPPDAWEGESTYGTKQKKEPDSGQWEYEFDTSGGTQKITQGKEDGTNYALAGKTAPNYKGAIGVTSNGSELTVEGCDIIVPKMAWTESHEIASQYINWSWMIAASELTGKINDAHFRGRDPGTVLFKGCQPRVSAKTADRWSVKFSFEYSPDVSGITIGGITNISKGGWDYLWVRYADQIDAASKLPIKKPGSVHVLRVYDEGDFSVLGIGTNSPTW